MSAQPTSASEKNAVYVFAAVEIEKAMLESDPFSRSQLIESAVYAIAYTMLKHIPVSEKLKSRGYDAGMIMDYVDSIVKSLIAELIAEFVRIKSASGDINFSNVFMKSIEKLVAVKVMALIMD